ncbi:MAG: hypothetical protein GTN87_09895 [Hydrotalea flava]|nr:hypothetical protein [Hydrotalea flava]
MTKLQGAVIREQCVTFAIVVVKGHILNSQSQAVKSQKALGAYFPGMPIILMAQDSRGIPKYWGRKDIVNFLANIHPSRIPWKEYTFSGGY